MTRIVQQLGPLLALLLVIACFSVADYQYGQGTFFTVRNLRVVLVNTAPVAVAALGMTLIIIAGGIDLSAGTATTLAATVLAVSLNKDYPVVVAVALTLATGAACGLVNGTLIGTLRIVPFIVTLGTMTLYLGLGKLLASNSTVFVAGERIPNWINKLCSTMHPDWRGPLPNIATGVWAALAIAGVVAIVLRFTVLGRHVFALGSNESTARLCGINVLKTKILVYVLAGLLVGIAGIYTFAYVKVANPIEGIGKELKYIAAVVIGGGSLSGGRGSVLGTLAGAAMMGVIASGCDQLEFENSTQDVLIGLIIIAAVALDQLRQRWQDMS